MCTCFSVPSLVGTETIREMRQFMIVREGELNGKYFVDNVIHCKPAILV